MAWRFQFEPCAIQPITNRHFPLSVGYCFLAGDDRRPIFPGSVLFPSVFSYVPDDADISVPGRCRPKILIAAGTHFLTSISILLTLIG